MKVSHDRRSPYPFLVDALCLLPGIRPLCERDRLGEAKHRASLSPNRTAAINATRVTLAQLEELFLYKDHGGPSVSPEGAAILLDLFRRGAFDASACREVEGGLELLTQYSKGLATIIDHHFGTRIRRRQLHAPAKRVKQPTPARSRSRLHAVLRGSDVIVHRLT